MLIKNYGHLWERKFINWGRPGVKGHLCGYESARSQLVDFRSQIGIYALFDANRTATYVGQAGEGKANLFDRLKIHETDHLWNRWDYFSWFGIRRVNGNRTLSKHDHVNKTFKTTGATLLNQLEGALITVLEPSKNKRGANWEDVEEYFQEIDEEVDDVSNGEVLRQINQLAEQLRKRG
jgi:hypothetical protein